MACPLIPYGKFYTLKIVMNQIRMFYALQKSNISSILKEMNFQTTGNVHMIDNVDISTNQFKGGGRGEPNALLIGSLNRAKFFTYTLKVLHLLVQI